MDRAASALSLRVIGGALAIALLGGHAQAEVDRPPHDLAFVPARCARYWAIPGGIASPAAWNQALSFAACVQDTTVARVDDVDRLPDLVDQLETLSTPALQVYLAVIEDAPGPVKVRATLQIALAQVALITRARSSIAAPPDLATNRASYLRYRELHARLEPLLEQPARFACKLIMVIDHEVTLDPSLARDVVTRNMVSSAREQAVLLRKVWSIPYDEADTRLVLGPR
ncbi:MAG TPA: hypothetical protein VF488_14370 [Gemmatimonadaceae bacterium]